MKIICERTLTEFQFWSGARHNALLLTSEELDEIEEVLEETSEVFGLTETDINDMFWFNFEEVCNLIGLSYDEDTDEVIRPDKELINFIATTKTEE